MQSIHGYILKSWRTSRADSTTSRNFSYNYTHSVAEAILYSLGECWKRHPVGFLFFEISMGGTRWKMSSPTAVCACKSSTLSMICLNISSIQARGSCISIVCCTRLDSDPRALLQTTVCFVTTNRSKLYVRGVLGHYSGKCQEMKSILRFTHKHILQLGKIDGIQKNQGSCEEDVYVGSRISGLTTAGLDTQSGQVKQINKSRKALVIGRTSPTTHCLFGDPESFNTRDTRKASSSIATVLKSSQIPTHVGAATIIASQMIRVLFGLQNH